MLPLFSKSLTRFNKPNRPCRIKINNLPLSSKINNPKEISHNLLSSVLAMNKTSRAPYCSNKIQTMQITTCFIK